MYKCTKDQELVYVSCSLARWQHFSAWSDVMDAIFKVWHQIENQTLSIDVCLLEEHSC